LLLQELKSDEDARGKKKGKEKEKKIKQVFFPTSFRIATKSLSGKGRERQRVEEKTRARNVTVFRLSIASHQ